MVRIKVPFKIAFFKKLSPKHTFYRICVKEENYVFVTEKMGKHILYYIKEVLFRNNTKHVRLYIVNVKRTFRSVTNIGMKE